MVSDRSQSLHLNMASPNPCAIHPALAVIYLDGVRVPISFPLGSNGVAHVTSLRLSLRFQISEDFMFIDEEVYDAMSGHYKKVVT